MVRPVWLKCLAIDLSLWCVMSTWCSLKQVSRVCPVPLMSSAFGTMNGTMNDIFELFFDVHLGLWTNDISVCANLLGCLELDAFSSYPFFADIFM